MCQGKWAFAKQSSWIAAQMLGALEVVNGNATNMMWEIRICAYGWLTIPRGEGGMLL